ncbi:MAG: hypothetical protein L0Y73_04310 [Candidatus Aminicenantes bacterium]|nr:hypothetical protein [Candidatus Aminicenantes bacterium]
MMKCKIIRLLYNAIPLNFLRAYLIDKHFSVCEACSAELADEAKIAEFIIHPGEVAKSKDLWPGIENEILRLLRDKRLETGRIPAGVRKWRLGIIGATILLVIMLVPFFLLKDGSGDARGAAGAGNDRIVIKSLRIGNQPIQGYFFHSKAADKVIVWVQKKSNE